jgi:hypothetical protein
MTSILHSHQQIDHPHQKNQQRNFRVKLFHRSNHMDLDICRLFHPTDEEHTLFIAAYEIFSKIGILCQKATINKHTYKTETISYILSEYDRTKL